MMAESTARRLDINRCTADRLSTVASIGLETARRVVAYRRRKQRFANIDEVSNVRGIAPKDLESLQQTTTVRQRKMTPAKSATKRSSSESPTGMKKVRRTVAKSATLPKICATESKRGKMNKPKTSRKGTQTIETEDSGGKKVKIAIRGVRKDEKLKVQEDRKVGLRRQTAARQQASSRRKGKRQPKEKLQKILFERKTLKVSTPTKSNKSSSPGSLMMCREAHRLKATEGLDYMSTGSPRPLLVLTSQREGREQARAQINNCAVTVHMMERAPLMSPMVTVNIPSSVLLTEARETGCGVERDLSQGIRRRPKQTQVASTSTPSVDVAIASVPPTGDGQKQQVSQTGTGTGKDLNDSNNKETDFSQEKVISESPQTNFIDDINNDAQEGYVAGSDTDHATDNGDSNVIYGSLPTKQVTAATVDKQCTDAFVLKLREAIPAPKSDMVSTSASLGRGKRRTRSRRQTAEKVKRWLVNSSSSNIEITPQSEQDLEDKRVAEDSFMSGVTLLPSTTPAQQKSGSSKAIPNSSVMRCKRGLEQELDTAVKTQPATGDQSSQTPPCRCRSCRRKRRAGRRSETAESSAKRPRTEAELSPDAHNQELGAAWCLLL